MAIRNFEINKRYVFDTDTEEIGEVFAGFNEQNTPCCNEGHLAYGQAVDHSTQRSSENSW